MHKRRFKQGHYYLKEKKQTVKVIPNARIAAARAIAKKLSNERTMRKSTKYKR
jgi:hypothetical protein